MFATILPFPTLEKSTTAKSSPVFYNQPTLQPVKHIPFNVLEDTLPLDQLPSKIDGFAYCPGLREICSPSKPCLWQ
jgi:hypothetical protein